jgi:hypothetical protein
MLRKWEERGVKIGVANSRFFGVALLIFTAYLILHPHVVTTYILYDAPPKSMLNHGYNQADVEVAVRDFDGQVACENEAGREIGMMNRLNFTAYCRAQSQLTWGWAK